ncbi:MAG: prepilin-type cleavage/methylation domain-containing protein [Chloroflexi bacterium]|nr:prepilin-type cleavage/methylation domain-containing protein [Chloroflexota bacterium]
MYSEKRFRRKAGFTLAPGFTLVELLVVIASIVILAGLLLPGLAMAKNKARTLDCLNNKHQFGVAWRLYAGDNDDWLAMNSPGDKNLFVIERQVWVPGQMNWQVDTPDNTNYALLRTPPNARLAPYLGTVTRVYKCPADRFLSPSQKALGWKERVLSVAMNEQMGDGETSGARKMNNRGPYVVFKKFSAFRTLNPARAWVIIDEHPDSIEDAFFTCNLIPVGLMVWQSLPASYHNGACTILFADAHAEVRKWVASLTKQPVTYVNWDGNYDWLWSSDRRDYDWLVERTTERLDGQPVVGTPR